MILEAIGRNADELNTPLCEFGCAASDFTELGGADRSKVCWMGEQDRLAQFSELLRLPLMPLTHESPIHSWNLIGPAVVKASKSGAVLPRRREGILNLTTNSLSKVSG